MFFMKSRYDKEMERVMQAVPGFNPRGSGVVVPKGFRYTPEMCDCKYCLHYKRKKCTVQECVCMKEPIEAGIVTYKELYAATFSRIKFPAFQERLNNLIEYDGSHLFYSNDHKGRFKKQIHDCANLSPEFLAAVFLLSVDWELWKQIKECISDRAIFFAGMHPRKLSADAYTLFKTAQDLYCGTRYITIRDISDEEIVDDDVFDMLCIALSIRRFGVYALKILDKDRSII